MENPLHTLFIKENHRKSLCHNLILGEKKKKVKNNIIKDQHKMHIHIGAKGGLFINY